MDAPEFRCGRAEADCRCGREADHDGEHVCELDRCHGAWTYDAEGRFQALRLPGNGDELFNAIFGPIFGASE